MPADIDLTTFQRTLRNIAVHDPYLGLGSGAELLVARMLAAVRLWPKGDADTPGFLDAGREFTTADWEAVLARLTIEHPTEGATAFNPFADREPSSLRPGTVEHYRRLILSSLGKSKAVSRELAEATLDLGMANTRAYTGRPIPEWEQVVAELVGDATTKSIFCGYEGTAGIALKLAFAGFRVHLDLPRADAASVYACLALAVDAPLTIRVGDPLQCANADWDDGSLKRFDAAIVIPPFGARLQPDQMELAWTRLLPTSSAESAGVVLALARARKSAICVLTSGFTFRSTKADQHFKELAVRDYGLDTVVGLPRGIFPGTSIAASLLTFSTGSNAQSDKRNQVQVIDAADRERSGSAAFPPAMLSNMLRQRLDDDFSAFVSLDELAANSFNLSPDRYVIAPEVQRLRELAEMAETVPLEDAVDIYRPQALPGKKGERSDSDILLSEIGAADIDEAGLIRTPTKQVALSEAAASPARKAKIEAGDVLLVIKGSVGKVGYVRDIPAEDMWLASQSFAVLRLRRHAPISDPRVLFRYLSSALAQANLQNLRVGTTVPGLQMADVRSLPIMLPSKEAQAAIVQEVEELFEMQDNILRLRQSLAARQATIWPDNLPSSRAKKAASQEAQRTASRHG